MNKYNDSNHINFAEIARKDNVKNSNNVMPLNERFSYIKKKLKLNATDVTRNRHRKLRLESANIAIPVEPASKKVEEYLTKNMVPDEYKIGQLTVLQEFIKPIIKRGILVKDTVTNSGRKMRYPDIIKDLLLQYQ